MEWIIPSAGEPLEVAAGCAEVAKGIAGSAQRAVDLLIGVMALGIAGADFIDGILTLDVSLAMLRVADHVVRVVT